MDIFVYPDFLQQMDGRTCVHVHVYKHVDESTVSIKRNNICIKIFMNLQLV
jgi:hypothetical protein